jgi:hypothetical protein
MARPRIVAPSVSGELEARLRAKLTDWRGLLTRDVASGRDVLRALLVEPFRFTPVIEPARRGYHFTGLVGLDRLVRGVITLENTRSSGVPNRLQLEPARRVASGSGRSQNI